LIRLTCATGNPGKLREFRMAAGPESGMEIQLLAGFSQIPPCAEDGSTFEENAILKARHYSRHAPGLLFADDSGLEVDALGGAPGVCSARFAAPDASDESNNGLLLERLQGIANRAARFVCVIALVEGQRLLRVFRGVVEGCITRELRGSGGFGYDPLFYYPPFGCTFGEVSAEQKFAVSHRGQALRAMLAWLSEPRS
jgi:XTP/dITP diphosphohydrolase